MLSAKHTLLVLLAAACTAPAVSLSEDAARTLSSTPRAPSSTGYVVPVHVFGEAPAVAQKPRVTPLVRPPARTTPVPHAAPHAPSVHTVVVHPPVSVHTSVSVGH